MKDRLGLTSGFQMAGREGFLPSPSYR
jgi:hypothetical protein